jgi:hypothetical protein
MRLDLAPEDDLLSRLPLPLAQLYRRACNAKSAPERHRATYYLWETALKLLGSAAVVSFLHTGRTPDARLAEILQALARPAVGHWWAMVRALTVELADSDEGFTHVKELLLGRSSRARPRCHSRSTCLVPNCCPCIPWWLQYRARAGSGRHEHRLPCLRNRLGGVLGDWVGQPTATAPGKPMGSAMLEGIGTCIGSTHCRRACPPLPTVSPSSLPFPTPSLSMGTRSGPGHLVHRVA